MTEQRWLRLRALGTAFLLGSLAGGSAIGPIYGRTLQTVRLERDRLAGQVKQAEVELNRLRTEDNRRQQRPVVQTLQVQVAHEDPAVRVAVEKAVQGRLRSLLGQPTDGPELAVAAYYLLQGLEVPVEAQPYRVETRAAVVGARFWVLVQPTPVLR